MVTEKIQEIAELKAKAAKLEAKMIIERKAEMASLPEKYGYESLKAFIKALREASGGRKKRRYRKRKGAKATGKVKKRKRAKITPEIREQVKAAVEAGKSGATIAKDFGISVPSVHNIKKSLGLVKARASS